MATPSPVATHYSLSVLRVTDIKWKRTVHSGVPDLYVQVQYNNIVRRTQIVKKNLSPEWDEMLSLASSSSDASTVLNIQIKHKSSVWKDPCVGYVDIELSDLVKKCANGEEAQLSLKTRSGKTSTVPAGVLHLRLEAINAMTSVDNDVKAAMQAVQHSGITSPAEAAVSSAVAIVDGAGNQLRDEAGLYESIGNLFAKLNTFVNLIDTLSEVHPYLKAAWTVASALYKGISNQFKVDKKVVDLVRAMDEALGFVHDVDSLPSKVRSLEQTIVRLLKQTVECCLFVRQYAHHRFAKRMLDLNSSSKIDEFKQTLDGFKDALNSGIVVHTALVSAQMSDKIDDLVLQQRLLLLRHQLEPHMMDAFDRPLCLPGTRDGIRDQVMDCLLSETDQNIIWLHGVAGSGKSTIASTMAEYFRDMGRLGAFLFFERGKSKPESVVRTIAYGLASFDTSIATHMAAAIQRGDAIATASAGSQFKKLLLEPLMSAAAAIQGPIVIILDALDECGTIETRRSLVQLFRKEFLELPKNFRFLITSRLETDIDKALSSRSDSVRVMELDYTSETSQNDVLSFIRVEMNRIVKEVVDVPDDWPWDTNLALLGKTSGGLFIWASTATKLVASCRDDPFQKLKDLVSDSRSLNGFGLYQLYATVLHSSGISWDNDRSKARFSQVLSLILFSKIPLTIASIDGIWGFPSASSSRFILSGLRCLLVYSLDEPIRLFHASFADYLVSKECSRSPWFIDTSAQKSILTTRCFAVMNATLHFNICDIATSYVPDERIAGLQDRVEKNIPPHLTYACLFWAQHLREAPYSPMLVKELSEFLYNRLLYWVEVLSLSKKINRASPALLDAMGWITTHDAGILGFLMDARSLVTRFALPISQSTPHIYLSALPLIAKESEVSAHYLKHTCSMLQVDRRGLERQSPLLKELKGHTGCVWSVAFSPDGTRVVSGSFDETIRVWDAESGEVISGPFEGHTDSIYSVAFSPDGARVVSGSGDSTVRVWDAESGEVVSGPFEGHTGSVYSVAFSPDGTRVVSGSDDTTVRIWDAESGEVVFGPFEGHTGGVMSVAFSPDGTRVVSGSGDNTIRIWDTECGEVVSGPFKGHTNWVNTVAFSPDGTRVVSGSGDKTIRVWDAECGEIVSGPFEGHVSSVFSVAFSPDGTHVVSGSGDKTIRVWDTENGEVVSGPFEGHAGSVYSVAFSPDGTRVMSGSIDKTTRVWDADSGEVVSRPFEGHTGSVNSVAFSPDGTCVVSGSRDNTVRVWDANNGKVVSGPFEGHTNMVTSVSFSPDGTRVVSASGDGDIRVWGAKSGDIGVWGAKSGEIVFSRFGYASWFDSFAFSPDGTRVAASSNFGHIAVRDAKSGENFFGGFGHTSNVYSIAFSPDGTRVVSGSRDKTIRVWDAESGEAVSGPFEGHTHWVNSVAFSPDGTRVVSGSGDSTIIVWDAESGEVVSGPFEGHTGSVCSVAFLPGGTRIVSGSVDNTVRVWNTESGKVVSGSFKGHTNSVNSVAFSPDGTRVVSGSDDRTIRIWDAESGEDISGPFEVSTYGVLSPPSALDKGVISNWTLAEDGWIVGERGELLVWAPPDLRPTLWRPQNIAVFSCAFSTRLDFSNAALGEQWQECYKAPE